MHQDRQLLDVTDLFRLGVRVHRNTLRRWIAAGIFPRPINVTQRHRYWDASEIRTWLETRKASRASSESQREVTHG